MVSKRVEIEKCPRHGSRLWPYASHMIVVMVNDKGTYQVCSKCEWKRPLKEWEKAFRKWAKSKSVVLLADQTVREAFEAGWRRTSETKR